jgi:hypothetical protein
MKKVRSALALLSVAALLASCSITLPVAATSNPVGGKVGMASGTVYLGLFAFDADASIRTAAKNGGITKIATVDMKTSNTLNLIYTYETIVTGE